MDKDRRNQLIDSKIKRTRANLEYNRVELEFARKMDRPAKRFEDRIAEGEQELKTLEEMRHGRTED